MSRNLAGKTIIMRPLTEKEKWKLYLYEQTNYDYEKFRKISKVIEGESHWRPSVQSFVRDRNGHREDSHGLVQVHLPSHPNITKEQANCPYFAIRFIVQEFEEGRAWQWTVYRNLKRRGIIN